ncbi:MAG: hypothetical protein ACK5HZ_04805 [Macellibacteroides fermentans]|uniref:hypothetical protein n=1 Tax=Macellibacteroides fermentans TaxID=879969 RepID=UPI003AD69962
MSTAERPKQFIDVLGCGYLCVERADGEQMVIDELFPKCKSISVDYAIMEKAKDMYVFPANSPE